MCIWMLSFLSKIGRYHALLQENNVTTTDDEQSTSRLPDPHEDPDGFLISLA